MKNAVRNLVMVAFLVVFTFGITMAQDEPVATDLATDECLNTKDERAAMREQRREQREAFRATLTEEQLAILENTELTRDEKRAALEATLTDAQKAMFENANMMRKEQNKEMCGSVTGEQLQKNRENARQNKQNRKGNGGGNGK